MRTLAGLVLLAALANPVVAAADETLPPPESIALPDLSAPLTASDLANGDKYFVFHRAGTDLAGAYRDIGECDAMARNLLPGTGNSPYQGVAAYVVIGAIVSANRRNVRRDNLRRCMFFKGYGRYALPKALWKEVSFDEGASPLSDEARRPLLLRQARIASGPRPAGPELGE